MTHEKTKRGAKQNNLFVLYFVIERQVTFKTSLNTQCPYLKLSRQSVVG